MFIALSSLTYEILLGSLHTEIFLFTLEHKYCFNYSRKEHLGLRKYFEFLLKKVNEEKKNYLC